jgi:glycosyltransferase involved in cell wall biosynthesis
VYEYFAAGKPVVTTPMRELEEYESRGLAASGATPEEFASALRRMLDSDTDARRRERMQTAQECSWESRAGAMLAAMGPGPEDG